MASGKQLTLFVTFHIRPDLIEQWKEAYRPVWAACSQEPECLFFDAFEDPTKPGDFRFVEVWSESREWFDTKQITKPYYKTLFEKTTPMWTREPEIEYWERLGEGRSFKQEFLTQ